MTPIRTKSHETVDGSCPKRLRANWANVASKFEKAVVFRSVTRRSGADDGAPEAGDRGAQREVAPRRPGRGARGARLGEAEEGPDERGEGEAGGDETGEGGAHLHGEAADGRPEDEAEAERHPDEPHPARAVALRRHVGDDGLRRADVRAHDPGQDARGEEAARSDPANAKRR